MYNTVIFGQSPGCVYNTVILGQSPGCVYNTAVLGQLSSCVYNTAILGQSLGCVYNTAVLGQPAGLSKEASLCGVGADGLKRTCPSKSVERSVQLTRPVFSPAGCIVVMEIFICIVVTQLPLFDCHNRSPVV